MNNLEIFKSRRFIASVTGLVVMVVVAFVPQLQPLEEALVEIIVDLATAF